MKYYYEVVSTNSCESDIFFSESIFQKKDVVVIPVSDEDFEIGTIVRKVSTTRGLKQEVDRGEVLPIIQKVNTADYIESRKTKAKKAQVLSILNAKMAEIKAMDVLEKFAGKDPSFASLLNEFKALANGQTSMDDEEELDSE